MLYKKCIGTMTLLVILSAVSLAAYSFVDASSEAQDGFDYDGNVIAKSPSSVTIMNDGKEAVRIEIEEDTDFVGQSDFGDIKQGDHVRINGQESDNSVTIATVVKRIDCEPGYRTGEE